MLRWLDFKKTSSIHLVLVISSPCFLSFSFLLTTRWTSSRSSMHLLCGIACFLCTCLLKYTNIQNSGRCKCTPHSMVVEVWFLPPGPPNWREKKSKGKSSNWLLGENSKRHNFTDSRWNHALQKVICSLKYKCNLNCGEGFWFIVISWISRQLNAASHV